MRIEEVGVGAPVGILAGSVVRGQQLQHILQNGEGMGAVEHTCPEADLPSQTPACGGIATIGERLLGSSEELVVGIR